MSFEGKHNRFGALDSICEDKSSIDVHGALVYTFEGERVDDLVCDAALNDRAGLCTCQIRNGAARACLIAAIAPRRSSCLIPHLRRRHIFSKFCARRRQLLRRMNAPLTTISRTDAGRGRNGGGSEGTLKSREDADDHPSTNPKRDVESDSTSH